LPEAIGLYQEALQVQPRNATVRNSLGAALFLEDRLPEAIQEFRQTLELEPSYINARYNLARALAASHDLDGAATEYAAYLQAEPDDAAAQAGLASVLFYSENTPKRSVICGRPCVSIRTMPISKQIWVRCLRGRGIWRPLFTPLNGRCESTQAIKPHAPICNGHRPHWPGSGEFRDAERYLRACVRILARRLRKISHRIQGVRTV
jgi:tetratricopeptide (TPR) repeat protein